MGNFIKNFIAILVLIIIGIILYTITLRGTWENPTIERMKETLNEPIKPFGTTRDRGRFILTQNLVEKKSFAFSREQADLVFPDAGYYKGNWYLLYPPGISIFAIPFYLFGTPYNLSQIASFYMGILFSIGNLVFTFLIARQVFKFKIWASIFASLVFGFASTSFSYAATLYQHQPTAFFIISSFYAVYKYKIHQKWGFLWGILIWINYSLAILVDYPNALLMLPVMIYFFLVSVKITNEGQSYKLKLRLALIFTSILFVLITILHGYYNLVNFGGVTKLSGSLIGFREGIDKVLDEGGDPDKGVKELSDKKNVVGFFREDNVINSSYELLIATDKGILFFSPIFILSFLGMILAFKQKKVSLEIGALILLVIVNLFFYFSWGDPWGGWAYGPRYLIPIMPVLSIFTAYWLNEFPRFKLLNRLFAFILFCYSAAAALLGTLTTNAVPPKVEADYLGIKYGYFFNLDLFNQGKAGTFIYNYFLLNHISLTDYYLAILASLVCIVLVVLFIMPLFSKKGGVDDFN